jgi:hypothetical protein
VGLDGAVTARGPRGSYCHGSARGAAGSGVTFAYGAQVAVEGLELATLHLIRNESPEVVAAFAAKLPVLIWTVRA